MLKRKSDTEILGLIKELAFLNEERTKRADELEVANKELVFQNEEKEKRVSELKVSEASSLKLTQELLVHQIELRAMNDELNLEQEKASISQKALVESELKFRSVADYTYDWEVWTGPDERIIYISPSCERISGYKQEEFMSDNYLIHKIIHPEDAAHIGVSSDQLRSSELLNIIDQFDFRIIKKDGSVVHIGHLSRPVFDDKGNYKGRRISNRDITDRKLAEEKLKQVSIRLDLANSINGVGIWDYNISENILVWNDQMFALYGTYRKDFTNVYEAWSSVIHPDDKKRGDKEIEMAISGEKEFDTEFCVIWPDGSSHYIRALATVQRDDSGKALRMIGTNWDITEIRKNKKENLNDSEVEYRSLFKGSPEGMLLIDKKGIIIDISEIGVLLFGENDRNHIIGQDIFQFISSGGNELFRNLLINTINEGSVQNVELAMLKKNQSEYFSEVSTTLIQDKYGNHTSLMLIVRDVSQRKKREAAQIHADRISTLGEIAAGIAHEINQPLNIISLAMDKILFETDKNNIVDVELLKSKSVKIFGNITRIRDIVDHIRAFSRINDGILKSFFDINSSITNASLMVGQQYIHHGINLNLQLGPQIPQIAGNTFKFEQVILNLLSNAKDALIEKKSQHQDAEMHIEIKSWQEDQLIFVDVTDNGCGIGKEDIHNVMLPFILARMKGKEPDSDYQYVTRSSMK